MRSDFATESSAATRTHVFPRPGSYAFICDFHSDMTGRVYVSGNLLAIPDFTVSPASPTVGASVTFEKDGADAVVLTAAELRAINADGARSSRSSSRRATSPGTRAP